MEGRSGKDVEPIEPIDAEEAVKAFRGYLREERRLLTEGEITAAKRARKKADEKYETVARMLTGRFRWHAKAAFGENLPHLVEEAQREMGALLCSDLMDLEPKNELYERKFNLCVKRLMIDAVRRVRVRQDMPAQGEIALWDYVPESLQSAEEENDDGEQAQPTEIPDDAAQAAFEQMLGDGMVQRILAYVSDESQRRIFVLRVLRGLTWAEVSREVGVSVSTAKRHYGWVAESLKRVIREWE